MLKKSILVSGVSNLSDARYCSGMGVDYLGVCTDRDDPSYLTVEKFNEINGWLSGINWVLQTSSSEVDDILKILEEYEVSGVYTHNTEIAKELDMQGVKVLLVVTSLSISLDFDNLLGIVIDYEDAAISPKLEEAVASKQPIYVTGDFTSDQLEFIRDNEDIHGVILNGGLEERPGFKNMDDLIDSLEIFEE